MSTQKWNSQVWGPTLALKSAIYMIESLHYGLRIMGVDIIGGNPDRAFGGPYSLVCRLRSS